MAGSRATGKLVQGVLVGLAGAALGLVLWASGLVSGLEAKTWDLRVSLLASPGRTTDDVVVILLDEDSLDWARRQSGLTWPWPREVYAFIVNFCRRAGARSLAFDVLFLDPSPYSVYDDQALGQAAAGMPGFVSAVFLGDRTGSVDAWPGYVPEPGLTVAGIEDWLADADAGEIEFSRASFPIPELAGGSALVANVHLQPDPDGVYRRASLFSVFDGRVVPCLSLGSYLVGQARGRELAIEPGTLVVNSVPVPMDDAGRALLNFRGPSGTHKTYGAAAILQSELKAARGEDPVVDPGELAGKHVLFGFSAPGLHDLRVSPVSATYPGVEVHATVLDNLLSGDFMRPVPGWAVILVTLLIALGAGVASSQVSGGLKNALVYAVFLPLPVVAGLAGYFAGYWVPVLAPLVAAVATLTGSGTVNYATEGRRKRFIKGAFSQYLSPAVIEQLIAHPERLKLGGEKRELSMFFSDLQGFTSISEGLSPEQLTGLLNEYLTAMTDIIQDEGGTVDKYEGDAIIAFWNAPVDQADHAARAVRAAMRCQAELARMRPGVKQRIGKDLYMRIGINTGHAVVGNLGSHTRFDYSMLGDAVNLAARLEGINKQFGTQTMISAECMRKMAGAYPVRELSRVAVVGRKEPVTVYEPMLPEEFAARARVLEVFDHGLKLFYKGDFAEAGRIFEGIAEDDPAAKAYARKCRELSQNPPEAWDGVWVMTSK